MRIRSIKPEFWRSEDITSLSVETRLLFIGLWSYVDDNGVGVDSDKIITADLFANEDEVNEWRDLVSRGLHELASRALVTRYTVSGKPFLYVNGWPKHQKIDRPSKARYPMPDEADAPVIVGLQPVLDAPSTHPRETASPGAVDQGSSGSVENLRSAQPSPPDRFAEFWEVFPKHVAKQAAERRWKVLIARGVDPSAIIAGAAAYADEVRRDHKERQFIKQPDGWMNAGRWEDEPAPVPPPRGPLASAELAPARRGNDPLASARAYSR
jgi:hypothetical protein